MIIIGQQEWQELSKKLQVLYNQSSRIERTLETMAETQTDLDNEITELENENSTFQADVKQAFADLEAKATPDMTAEIDRLKVLVSNQKAADPTNVVPPVNDSTNQTGTPDTAGAAGTV